VGGAGEVRRGGGLICKLLSFHMKENFLFEIIYTSLRLIID